MDQKTLEQTPIETLLRGYDLEHYRCVWCGKKYKSESAACAHLDKEHPPESRLYQIMGASALGLSHSEQVMSRMLFEGATSAQIARALGLSDSTVRVMKKNLTRRDYDKAKLLLMLCELLPPPRKYTKTEPVDLVPHMTAEGEVLQFISKSEAHDPITPKLHPSCLVLALRQPSDQSNDLSLLVCNKASKARMSQGEKPPKPDSFLYDTVGGQCDARGDFPGLVLDENNIPKEPVFVTPEVYLRSAMRESCEELLYQGKPLDAETHFSQKNGNNSLVPLWNLPYDGKTPDGSYNLERSAVFAWWIPKELENGMSIQDTYTDSMGVTCTYQFPSEYISFDRLIEMYRKNPAHFLDGLGRILAHCVKENIGGKELAAIIATKQK